MSLLLTLHSLPPQSGVASRIPGSSHG